MADMSDQQTGAASLSAQAEACQVCGNEVRGADGCFNCECPDVKAASLSGHEALVKRLHREARFAGRELRALLHEAADALSAASPAPCAACAEREPIIAHLDAHVAALDASLALCERHQPELWEGDGTCVLCEGDRMAARIRELEARAAETSMLRSQLRAAEDGRIVDRLNLESQWRHWLRHEDDCDAAAWEQRKRKRQVPTYSRPACSCGLDAAMR